MSLDRAWFFCFASLIVACSSSAENPPETVTDASTAEVVVDETSTTSDAPTEDVSSESATTDTGPCGKRDQPCCSGTTCEKGLACTALPTGDHYCQCDTSLCDRFGYVCDGNTQVGCGPTAPGSCYVPITKKDCPADSPCSPATGTCGGCDAHDDCAGKADGTFLGCLPYTAQWCRKGTDGCSKTVNETCGIACVGGARNGCCGGEGQMCCSPPGAACASGLSCKSEVCAK
ncbi:MAG: hypothetical protein ACXVEE_31305 [Polyangiales bacterium]